MNFTLSGGTDQQRQWFNDATDAMTLAQFPFDNFATNVTVTWVAESVLQNESHSYGRFTFALTRYDGGTDTATLQIFEGLDTRTDDNFQGKDFYVETVAHEIGHVVSGRLDDATIEQICGLFNEHSNAWQTGGWETRIVEGCSEIIKDTYQPGRKFDNRTTRFIQQPNFAQLMTLLGLVGAGIFPASRTVLGEPLGEYNLGDWGAWFPPNPGYIYGIQPAEPGQPAIIAGNVTSYDYVLLPDINPLTGFITPWWLIYPFVPFWQSLPAPHAWRLTLLIHGPNVAPFDPDPGGSLPAPGVRIGHFIWGPYDRDVLFGDLVNVTTFPGSWSGELPLGDASAIAAQCMSPSGTPFFTWRDYTGWRGFNGSFAVPYDGFQMRWDWLEGTPGDPPPWPYHDPELALGLGGFALRPKHPHIIGPAGPETSLR